MSTEQKTATIKEFDLKKGRAVATLSGIMSACFAYGLAAGAPIKALTLKHGGSSVAAFDQCDIDIFQRSASGTFRAACRYLRPR